MCAENVRTAPPALSVLTCLNCAVFFNSLLASLNSRDALQARLNEVIVLSPSMTSQMNRKSGKNPDYSSAQRPGNETLELGL